MPRQPRLSCAGAAYQLLLKRGHLSPRVFLTTVGDPSPDLRRSAVRETGSASVFDILVEAARVSQVSVREVVATGSGRRGVKARAVAAWLARETGHLTLSEFSRKLNRDLASLSLGACRVAREARSNAQFAAALAAARAKLLQAR